MVRSLPGAGKSPSDVGKGGPKTRWLARAFPRNKKTGGGGDCQRKILNPTMTIFDTDIPYLSARKRSSSIGKTERVRKEGEGGQEHELCSLQTPWAKDETVYSPVTAAKS